jgi:pimeloyl-ACP methyl ester carboxylesterase
LKSYGFVANGIRLAVHDWGGDGPPTLLAHATGFHGVVWKPVAERLVAAGRRVFSFDFRGHGDSDAPALEVDSYSWRWFASDVLAVAEHLDVLGDATLVACGHSKGGASLLLGEADRPGSFPRIWAFEPIVFKFDAALPPQDDFPLARSARKRRNEWPSIEAAREAYASKPPLDVMTDEALRSYVEYGLRDRGDGVYELRCRPEVEARVYAMGPNNGVYERLPEIGSRVVVVCGEISTDVKPSFGTTIVERLAHARLEVMPGVGHFGPQQDPEACVESILRFANE